jgi:CrcB protein
MKTLVQYGAVAAGGALGAMARLGVATVCARLFGTGFPTGTFVINITGSLILGWFYGMASARVIVPDVVRAAVAIGFVGAYTTFSTYMYESNELIADGAWWKASGNLFGSLIVGLIAVRAGMLIAR